MVIRHTQTKPEVTRAKEQGMTTIYQVPKIQSIRDHDRCGQLRLEEYELIEDEWGLIQDDRLVRCPRCGMTVHTTDAMDLENS